MRIEAQSDQSFVRLPEQTDMPEIQPESFTIQSAGYRPARPFAALGQFTLGRRNKTMRMRLAERQAERTRVAQDLHDSLLQSFLNVSTHLRELVRQTPADSPVHKSLGEVATMVDQVIDQGRGSVLNPDTGPDDLIAAFAELRGEDDRFRSAELRIVTEGRALPLDPFVRQRLYLVGREALVNAFRHSGAKCVELEMQYRADEFVLVVRDNGCGMCERPLAFTLAGRCGLRDMRERAEEMGARLRVFSRKFAGTEVELTIPGGVAFGA